MAYVQLNPWHKPSRVRGNDSILVPFLNEHHAHFRYFGEYKRKGRSKKDGTPRWLANQKRGTFHLVGTDSCEWDIPVEHYETFLELLFQEDPQRCKWFFIEPMYDLHKMYLDFDFKTPEPVDYDTLADAIRYTCELVWRFFNDLPGPSSLLDTRAVSLWSAGCA